MAATEKQIEANRSNAKKSTGPQTEAGKKISRMNATRHGLTGQYFCMSETDMPYYKTFEESMMADLKPVGAYETQLAISIVQNQWRLNRFRGIEYNIFGRGHDHLHDRMHGDTPNIHAAAIMAETYRDEHKVIGTLSTHESRIRRFIAQDRKELKEMQAERRATEEEASQLAAAMLEMEKEVGPGLPGLTPTKVEVNGFVFTRTEVQHRELLRRLSKRPIPLRKAA